MKRTNVLLAVTTVILMAQWAGVGAQAPAAAPANPLFKRTPVQQVDLTIPGREVVQAVAEILPNGASGRHTHPGDEVGYVVSGPLVVEIDGKPAKTLQTGEGFLIPAGTVHNARNTGTAVVKVLATYIIEKGKPVTTPVTTPPAQ